MSQDLQIKMKVDSEVPQAVDRAKDAITSLEKRASAMKIGTTATAVEKTTEKATSNVSSQFDKIGKAFGNTISSVFLSFAGPMVLLSGIMGFITNSIADARQLAQDGLNKIAEGQTKLATTEEKTMANFFKAKDEREKEEKMVKAGKEEMTMRFLRETDEGKRIMREAYASGRANLLTGEGDMSKAADMQKKALDAFLNSPEGKKYASLFEAQKNATDTFKAPEGFSNVVGVGANPVLQAMDDALTESKKQTGLLETIASGGKSVFADDFTKTSSKFVETASKFSIQ